MNSNSPRPMPMRGAPPTAAALRRAAGLLARRIMLHSVEEVESAPYTEALEDLLDEATVEERRERGQR